jgi:hypothetical protein
MPKASYDRDSMYAPSARGFVEMVGSKKLGEVTGCVSRFTQWQPNKKTGAQLEPLTSVMLSIAAISADGTRTAEPIEQELVVEWGPKDGSMIRVRPGLADSRDGEAGDTVDENGTLVLGTEGNCLFVEEGTKINMTNSFGVFVVSCQDKAFKAQILNAGYLPDLVGMRAWFDLRPRKYNDKTGAEKTAEEFVVDSITRYPYEAAAAPAKAAGKPKAAAAAAPKVNGAPKPPAAPAPTADNGGDEAVESVCLGLLKAVSTDVAASPNSTLNRSKIVILALQKALDPKSGIAKTQHKAIQETLKNSEWFESNAISFGGVNAGDDQYMLTGA